MMEESSKMIIDSVNRLQQAVADLRTLVVRRTPLVTRGMFMTFSQISATKVEELAEDEEFVKARETLEVACA
jgi:hypothetical protein